MPNLSKKLLEKKIKQRCYNGIIFVYEIRHAGQANVDFIERRSRFFDGMYSYYNIDGKRVF